MDCVEESLISNPSTGYGMLFAVAISKSIKTGASPIMVRPATMSGQSCYEACAVQAILVFRYLTAGRTPVRRTAVRRTCLESLPAQVGQLTVLQTLDLNECSWGQKKAQYFETAPRTQRMAAEKRAGAADLREAWHRRAFLYVGVGTM